MPLAAMSLSVSRTARMGVRGRRGLVARQRAAPRASPSPAWRPPSPRVAFIWWPNGDYEPIRPGEQGTIGEAVEQRPGDPLRPPVVHRRGGRAHRRDRRARSTSRRARRRRRGGRHEPATRAAAPPRGADARARRGGRRRRRRPADGIRRPDGPGEHGTRRAAPAPDGASPLRDPPAAPTPGLSTGPVRRRRRPRRPRRRPRPRPRPPRRPRPRPRPRRRPDDPRPRRPRTPPRSRAAATTPDTTALAAEPTPLPTP